MTFHFSAFKMLSFLFLEKTKAFLSFLQQTPVLLLAAAAPPSPSPTPC